MKALDHVGGSMFLSEARELVGALMYLVEDLEQSSSAWIEHDKAATAQVKADHQESFSREAFEDALRGTGRQQTAIFSALESLWAAWARLSLLFHPIGTKGSEAEWRQERGRLLRAIAGIPDDTLLSRRSFRDAWMHFDERMDQAYAGAWLGNRQEFVRTSGAEAATERTVRVIDVETLTFHYRTQSGQKESVSIAEIKACLSGLMRAMEGARPRLMALLPPPARPLEKRNAARR